MMVAPALRAVSGAVLSGEPGGSASARSEFERLRHPQSSAGAEQHAPVSAFGVGSPQHAFLGAAASVLVELEVPQQGLEAGVAREASSGEGVDMIGTVLNVVAITLMNFDIDMHRKAPSRAGAAKRGYASVER